MAAATLAAVNAPLFSISRRDILNFELIASPVVNQSHRQSKLDLRNQTRQVGRIIILECANSALGVKPVCNRITETVNYACYP
jgi:hypothetical protein